MKTDKTNLYLLAIVAIVAVVGIAVLMLNSGVEEQVAVVDEDGDIVGLAIGSRMGGAGCAGIQRRCPSGTWQLDMDTGRCRCTPDVEASGGGTAARASADEPDCSIICESICGCSDCYTYCVPDDEGSCDMVCV